MKSAYGVFQSVEESDYIYEIYDLKFYFSSMFYLNKFKNDLDKYIEKETLKLKNRYKINCEFKLTLILSLYKSIEKRGFKVMFGENRFNENSLIKDCYCWEG